MRKETNNLKRKLYIGYVLNFTLITVSFFLLKLSDRNDSNVLLVISLVLIIMTVIFTVFIVIKTCKYLNETNKKSDNDTNK